MKKQYFKKLIILLFINQVMGISAQGLSPAFEVKQAVGEINMEKHTIFFCCSDGRLDKYYVIRVGSDVTKTVLDARVAYGRFSGEVKSYFPNGSLRSKLNCSTVASKNDLIYTDPLLGLPISYCLNGLSEMWTLDRSVHFKIYYKDNVMIADSMEFAGKMSPISAIGLRIDDLSIENLLYYPELLSELQAEVEKKKMANTSGRRFANNNYIHAYVSTDFENDKKMSTYKAYSRVIDKVLKKDGDVIIAITVLDYKVKSIEVNSPLSKGDKKIILNHLNQLVTEAGIELNHMNAEGEIIIKFYLGGC